ncbi:MAG: GIY-YIG nuclease family protein [Candidatus Omnitrophica bacterium]|nr:GIY-YIG nuclease family protein [Candidatus Omnitrophota bacterium]
MYYVYVLHSQKDYLLYVGSTKNIKSRVQRHNAGLVPATKFRRPLRLILYEAYIMKSDAVRRESYFKTTKGKVTLKIMLKDYFRELNK